MDVISLLFLIWGIYLFLGFLWLNHTIKKDYIKEYNVIGTTILVIVWPIHLIYTKVKNGIF